MKFVDAERTSDFGEGIMTRSQNLDVPDGPGGADNKTSTPPGVHMSDRREFLPSLDRSVTRSTIQIRDDPFATSEIRPDREAMECLTGSRAINWCPTLQRVYPVLIAGGGERFLGAVTTAMWGVNRMASLLQRLIYVSLVEFGTTKFRERWHRQRKRDSEVIDSQTLDQEWDEMVRVANCEEHRDFTSGVTFPEPLHVFALSNILKRPIIIISRNSNNLNSHFAEKDDLDFSGIYLPLLWNASDCVRTPLVLALHDGHFVPLVGAAAAASSDDLSTAVPLVNSELEPLRVLFLLEDEEKEAFGIQSRYFDLMEARCSQNGADTAVLCARLRYSDLEKDVDISTVCQRSGIAPRRGLASEDCRTVLPTANGASGYSEFLYPRLSMELPHQDPDDECRSQPMENPRCPVEGCVFYGQFEYDWMCSRCFVQHGRSDASRAQHGGRVIPGPESGHNGPTAPSASIVTLNRLAVDIPNYQDEPSIMYEHCRQDGCHNFVSKYTRPYCYEHVGGHQQMTTRQPACSAQTVEPPSVEVSIMMERCRHRGCPNYTSQFVYPVCYEHIDDRFTTTVVAATSVTKTADNPRSDVSTIFDPPLMSMVDQRCAVTGCPHFASKFTYPVCYEHLDMVVPASISRHSGPPLRTASFPAHNLVRPQVPATRAPASSRWNPAVEMSRHPAAPVDDGNRYLAALVALEQQSRTTTVACRTPACTNYGNSKCIGYCHECHEMLATIARLP